MAGDLILPARGRGLSPAIRFPPAPTSGLLPTSDSLTARADLLLRLFKIQDTFPLKVTKFQLPGSWPFALLNHHRHYVLTYRETEGLPPCGQAHKSSESAFGSWGQRGGFTGAGQEPCHYPWHLRHHTELRGSSGQRGVFSAAQHSADKCIIN